MPEDFDRNQLLLLTDIVVDLKVDGTYEVIKDRSSHFEKRDQRIYGVFHKSKEVIISRKIKVDA